MSQEMRTDAQIQLNELGQLSAGVGHHVINAFAAIVSNAEILKMLAEAPVRSIDPKDVVETIIRTALDAAGVARRLIDYSRSATAPGEGPVRLDRLAAAVVESERGGFGPEIEWRLQLDPVPTIRGHELQLAAMIRQILHNAREALPAGGAVTVSTSTDEHNWVLLEIADNGRGMSSDEQMHAVEPFFTTKSGHAGVGLSIANGIWRRHRGTFAVSSRPGEGTRVRLRIEPIDARS